MNFKRTVDGQNYGYLSKVVARLPDGQDITQVLAKNRIPLSRAFLLGIQEEGWLSQNPDLQTKLRKLNLLDEKGMPKWQDHTVFYWQQSFPARKKTLVTHAYKPAAGYNWAMPRRKIKGLDDILLADGKLSWKEFCPTADFEKTVLELFQGDHDLPVYQVRRIGIVEYVLKTGAHWRGGIGDFTLKVIPPEGMIATFCPPQGTSYVQDDQGRLVMQLHDFTPHEDLRVLFVKRAKEG